MDHDGPREATRQLRNRPVRARTIVVRWWHDDPHDPLRCRGTVRSIDSEQLGSFDDLDGLLALVRGLASTSGNPG